MTRIVLVMHDPLGQAFASCARHVLGHAPNLLVFDVAADDQPEDRVPQLYEQLLRDPAQHVLVLSDIYGATPFNIAVQVLKRLMAQGKDTHLITGTNLCMVLKALTESAEDPERFAEGVRQGALRGIVDADEACTKPQSLYCHAKH